MISKELGRNQMIGLLGFGFVMVIGVGLVFAAKLSGEAWYYGGLAAVGSLIGVGGMVNSVKSIGKRE